jgi:prepilin-type N-terminal cleavage/methylation domain-containing protein/prepilin-type processing-associated H-X9-DG protein
VSVQINSPKKLFKIDRRAFTLIELLIVLVVLGILAAIVFPAVGSTQMSAKKAQCASNMRQIGIGLQLYANLNAGEYPQTTHSLSFFRRNQSWIFALSPFLDDVNEVRVCPADAEERQRFILRNKFTSYVLNDLVFDNHNFNGPAKLSNPSKTPILFILSETRTPSVTQDHIHGAEWSSWNAALNDIEPDRHRVGNRSNNRLQGSANYLFADGSVQNIDAKSFKRLFERGINPADPN